VGYTDRTNAERQRRYIARLKAAAKAAKRGVTNAKPCAACAAKDRAFARLKAQLARLRAENAGLRRRRKPTRKGRN
jgi:hypothetical protein